MFKNYFSPGRPASMAASHESKPGPGSVAILGAGISGLAAAYQLKNQGVAVTVFEAEDKAGGKIGSITENGLTWEKGPNTMVESEPELSRLIDELHLREKQQFPLQQSKRYIVRNGKPELLPSNPLALLGSRLLSGDAKLKLLLEPFLWKRKSNDSASGLMKNESVAEFLGRHFGDEVVDYLVDPFVAGTSGSDPASLSVRHAFPDLLAMEDRYGSLIVGAVKSAFARKRLQSKASKSKPPTASMTERKKQPRGPFSFFGGLQSFIDALAERIGQDHLSTNSKVLSLAYNQQGNPQGGNWKVSYLRKDGKKGQPLEQYFDAIITTTPIDNFREIGISKDGKPYSLDFIPEVVYQPISVLVMAFKKEDVKRPLQGFGVLIPSKEQENGLQSLGTIFTSSMFPDRAPTNQIVFTTLIGGSRNPSLASRSIEDLEQVAIADLQKIAGVGGKPVTIKHIFWSKAFPQYGLSYGKFITALEALENELPGLFYAGNHIGGLSVGKALASGCKSATDALKYLDDSGRHNIVAIAPANC